MAKESAGNFDVGTYSPIRLIRANKLIGNGLHVQRGLRREGKTALVDSTTLTPSDSVWSSGDPGAMQEWHIDPETTHMQRFLLRLLAPFAPEELL